MTADNGDELRRILCKGIPLKHNRNLQKEIASAKIEIIDKSVYTIKR